MINFYLLQFIGLNLQFSSFVLIASSELYPVYCWTKYVFKYLTNFYTKSKTRLKACVSPYKHISKVLPAHWKVPTKSCNFAQDLSINPLLSSHCQTADFRLLFDGNSVVSPLKPTYRGTWIRRYIKESTSVSLSGSPLNTCSFLICSANKEKEEVQHINCLWTIIALFMLLYKVSSWINKQTSSESGRSFSRSLRSSAP